MKGCMRCLIVVVLAVVLQGFMALASDNTSLCLFPSSLSSSFPSSSSFSSSSYDLSSPMHAASGDSCFICQASEPVSQDIQLLYSRMAVHPCCLEYADEMQVPACKCVYRLLNGWRFRAVSVCPVPPGYDRRGVHFSWVPSAYYVFALRKIVV